MRSEDGARGKKIRVRLRVRVMDRVGGQCMQKQAWACVGSCVGR